MKVAMSRSVSLSLSFFFLFLLSLPFVFGQRSEIIFKRWCVPKKCFGFETFLFQKPVFQSPSVSFVHSSKVINLFYKRKEKSKKRKREKYLFFLVLQEGTKYKKKPDCINFLKGKSLDMPGTFVIGVSKSGIFLGWDAFSQELLLEKDLKIPGFVKSSVIASEKVSYSMKFHFFFSLLSFSFRFFVLFLFFSQESL